MRSINVKTKRGRPNYFDVTIPVMLPLKTHHSQWKKLEMWRKHSTGSPQIMFAYAITNPGVLESGIQLKESRIPLTIGIQNPSSFDKDPESTAWDPESKTIPHFLRRGDRKEIGLLLTLMYSRWRNLFFLVFFSSSGGSRVRVRTPRPLTLYCIASLSIWYVVCSLCKTRLLVSLL